jgi:hypothetical protein
MRRATRIKLIGCVCALVGVLLLPATAVAGKEVRTLRGKLVGDENSRVSLKVVLKNKKPKRVKGLRFENLNAYCSLLGGAYVGELSGTGGVTAPGDFEVDPPPLGWTFTWFSYPQNPSRMIEMNGKLLRKFNFNRARGTMAVYSNEEFNQCGVAKGTFRVKK